ncbi:hypothetical protein ACTOB_001050 [Actinoplanes oblitus]|uniref:Uncharacterized protein n=1 Tax=Actinoplanes oblitus TaxID=3040509 RepID=A0ABY8WJ61_9ACTN|nr:hypothetical protein [Actinoplanes oblitus]WIM97522.1 hypothetical protein ACTOB_001050 [Actinoplanes oblitus]
MSRRIAAIFALATATAGLTAAATAGPAAAAPFRGPEPITTWLRPVPANVPSWIDIAWRTDRTICDARVQVRGDRVRVDYLGNRRGALFSRGATLSPWRTDVTRVRVTPYAMRVGVARLWATISYDECGWRSRTQMRTTVLSLPVLRNSSPGGQGGPGGPGTGLPGGPIGHGGPGQGQDGPGQGGPGQGQGGPGQGGPGQGQGGPGQGGPGHDHSENPQQGGANPGGSHSGGGDQGGPQQGWPSHGGPGQDSGHH